VSPSQWITCAYVCAPGTFEGEFRDGRFEFAVDAGEVKEAGEFRGGALDGKGRREFGREVYEGEFVTGYYHGTGVLEVAATGLR
jgi:hypothetical protein